MSIGQMVLLYNSFMKLRIRDIREDRDITQKQIADYLMCDQSLYSKYERGEREIPLRLLIALAEYYDVSLDYLAGLSNDKSPYADDRK
jgi:transcriptional regulator with XRE-family HTH domain